MKQKEIFPLNLKHRDDVISIKNHSPQNISKRKIISSEKLLELKHQLNQLMLHEEPYLNTDINLASLAELLKITPHQLSYVINNGFNQNFFSLSISIE